MLLRMAPLFAGLVLILSCGQGRRGDGADGGNLPTGSDRPLDLLPEDSPSIEIQWENGPSVGGDNGFLLKLTMPSGWQIRELTVTPWMTIHRHGSGNVKPVVTAVADSVGVYRVTNVSFVMSGPWDLKVLIRSSQSAASAAASTETRITIPVEVPAR